jgi:hypothetical protein
MCVGVEEVYLGFDTPIEIIKSCSEIMNKRSELLDCFYEMNFHANEKSQEM